MAKELIMKALIIFLAINIIKTAIYNTSQYSLGSNLVGDP